MKKKYSPEDVDWPATKAFNANLTELRSKVIDAICFKPHITGHIEQFEAVEALVRRREAEAVRRELEKMKREWGYGDTGMDWEEWIDKRLTELTGLQGEGE